MFKVKDGLYSMTTKDTLSLIMFVLFQIRNVPEMAPLSQLAYLVDEESFMKIVKYYGGQTITFPKYEEVKNLLSVLMVYDDVEISKTKTLSEALAEMSEEEKLSVLRIYKSVKEALRDYEFV